MTKRTEGSHLIIIERQKYWRDLSVRTLTEAGYTVYSLDNYDYPPPSGRMHIKEPDLVIVGCASLGSEEHELIERILSHGQHVLVLSVNLPWKVMRTLFLAGVDDVSDKPYDPKQLVTVVRQALDSTAYGDRTMDWEMRYE